MLEGGRWWSERGILETEITERVEMMRVFTVDKGLDVRWLM